MSTITTIVGLPGVGKTRLALSLASAWPRPRPVLLLHTDLLKVTARELGADGLRGPGWADPQKAARAQPLLSAHARKAKRDGYDLIVEGTLALGFHPPGGRVVVLALDEARRTQRIAQKHLSARASLEAGSVSAYAEALAAWAPPGALRLDASAPVEALVRAVLRYP